MKRIDRPSGRCRTMAVLALLATTLVLPATGCREGVLQEGWTPSPDGPVWSTYRIRDGYAVMGDEVFRLEYLREYQETVEADLDGTGVQGFLISDRDWGEHGWEIPFVIDPGLSSTVAGDIVQAVQAWNEASDVRWIPRVLAQQQEDYVRFVLDPNDAASCRAETGRQGGEQMIWLPLRNADVSAELVKCSRGTIVHEMGHAMGLRHEHQRFDRDDHVDFVAENVDPGLSQAAVDLRFEKLVGASTKTGSLEVTWRFGDYDYRSIMHYSSTASGVCANEQNGICLEYAQTLMPRSRPGSLEQPVPAAVLGQRSRPSKNDVAGLNAIVRGSPRNDDGLFNARSILAIEDSVPGARDHLTGDFNGDGRTDLAYIRGDDNDIWVSLAREDGTLAPATSWHPSLCGAEICTVGDLQGDGIDDIIFVTTDGLARIARSDGQGSFRATAGSVWLSVVFTDFDHVAVGDVNGDCEMDFVGFRQQVSDQGSPYTQVYLFSKSWTGFRSGTFMGKYHAASDQEVGWGHLADVDRDERPDIVMVTTTGDVYVALNDGVIDGVYPSFGGRSPVFELWSRGTCTDAKGCRIHDMDGDGRADVVMMDPEADHWLDRVRIALSTGFEFRDDVPNYHDLDCRRDVPCLLGDVDGHGLADLIDPIGRLDPRSDKRDRQRGDVWISLATDRVLSDEEPDSFFTEDIGPRNTVPPKSLAQSCIDWEIDPGF